MLESVVVSNLRNWRGDHEVPLRPLTLIYGWNSAGKSTLFHALALLRQTLVDGHGGASVPLATVGERIRLGDFRSLVSDHDEALPLRLGISYRGASHHPFLQDAGSARRIVAEFGRSERGSGGELKSLSLQVGSPGYMIQFHQATAGAAGDGEGGFEVGTEHRPDFTAVLSDLLGPSAAAADLAAIPIVASGTVFHFRRGLPSVGLVRQQLRDEHLNRGTSAPELEDAVARAEGVPATDRLLGHWSRLCSSLGDELEAALGRVRHIGPLRRPLDHLVPLADEGEADYVGFSGERTIHCLARLWDRDPNLPEVRRAAHTIALGYGVQFNVAREVKQHDQEGQGSAFLPQRVAWISLQAASGREEVPRDVGSGISQVLPFLVQLAAGDDLITIVEQPEIHLNPQLQVRVAQLLIDFVFGEYSDGGRPGLSGRQIIVETHSEEMLLRLESTGFGQGLDWSKVAVLGIRSGTWPPQPADGPATPDEDDKWGYVLHHENGTSTGWLDDERMFQERYRERTRFARYRG